MHFLERIIVAQKLCFSKVSNWFFFVTENMSPKWNEKRRKSVSVKYFFCFTYAEFTDRFVGRPRIKKLAKKPQSSQNQYVTPNTISTNSNFYLKHFSMCLIFNEIKPAPWNRVFLEKLIVVQLNPLPFMEPKVHYRDNKSPALANITSQFYPSHPVF
jgi:hypothetical protein